MAGLPSQSPKGSVPSRTKKKRGGRKQFPKKNHHTRFLPPGGIIEHSWCFFSGTSPRRTVCKTRSTLVRHPCWRDSEVKRDHANKTKSQTQQRKARKATPHTLPTTHQRQKHQHHQHDHHDDQKQSSSASISSTSISSSNTTSIRNSSRRSIKQQQQQPQLPRTNP